MAVYFVAMYLCGASFGPLVTGGLSDHFAARAAIGGVGSGHRSRQGNRAAPRDVRNPGAIAGTRRGAVDRRPRHAGAGELSNRRVNAPMGRQLANVVIDARTTSTCKCRATQMATVTRTSA
jgi:hypothetical protein